MKFVFHIFLALLFVCFPAFAQSGSPKICLAYCTYYGNMLPDPNLVTHINYAFAELYVKNGVYQQFKLQGNESRFKSVMQLKQQNPNLKICLSFTHTVSNSDNSQGGGFSAMAASPEMRKQFEEKFQEIRVEFASPFAKSGTSMESISIGSFPDYLGADMPLIRLWIRKIMCC